MELRTSTYFLRCASLFFWFLAWPRCSSKKSKPDWLIFFLFSANQFDWIIGKDFRKPEKPLPILCTDATPPHHTTCVVVSILRQDLTKSCIFIFEDKNTTCYQDRTTASCIVMHVWMMCSLVDGFFLCFSSFYRTYCSPFFFQEASWEAFWNASHLLKKPSRPSWNTTKEPQPLPGRGKRYN